jgi:bacteriocin-like protein
MAEKISIGLKKKGKESHEEGKRPDIELTEEDLKQISGGTTKAVQIRPETIE